MFLGSRDRRLKPVNVIVAGIAAAITTLIVAGAVKKPGSVNRNDEK